jgi:hypothetical protein
MTEEEARSRFGFFLEALEYGTPPHGGIALGLDRIVMILAGADSLREVIPFPKTAAAKDLMMEAPTPVAKGSCGSWGCAGTGHTLRRPGFDDHRSWSARFLLRTQAPFWHGRRTLP